jgi:hypothetical protein
MNSQLLTVTLSALFWGDKNVEADGCWGRVLST